MSDYISREALIKAVEGNPYVTDSVKSYVRCTARSIPSADVRENVKARWIDMGDHLLCSGCGATHYGADKNFCPNCGAGIREETE